MSHALNGIRSAIEQVAIIQACEEKLNDISERCDMECDIQNLLWEIHCDVSRIEVALHNALYNFERKRLQKSNYGD